MDSLAILWIIGWLFTIGFLQLSLWRGVLSLVIWPYYLGIAINKIIKIKPVNFFNKK